MCFSLFVCFILTFLLNACNSTASYQQLMQQWHGKNIQVLQRSWGQPNSAIKLHNGHTLYQYTRKNFFTIPEPKRQSINSINFVSYAEPWLSNQTMVGYCITTFESDTKGNIIDTNFKGNNCFAPSVH